MISKKTIIVLLVIIIISVSSASAGYILTINMKNKEIENIKSDYEDKIDNLAESIIDLQTENHNLNINLQDLNLENINLKDNWDETNNSLDIYKDEIQDYRSGNKYNMHDPSYSEVAAFISYDKTDEIEFDFDTFDCEDYSMLVNNNAEEQGIRCALVVMYFDGTDTGHAIVGFDTIDRGMVYVEPQTDDWVENFEIGNDYWTECVVPGGYYDYTEDPNDTINEILIYW